MKTMLLAAGKGERMRPLTLNTPKPLLRAGGKPLIQHQIEKLAASGYTDLVINHAWLGEQLEAAFGNGSELGVTIQWSREGEPLETAGGIVHAMPFLEPEESFLCVNTDIWTDLIYADLPSVDGETLLAWLVLVPNPAHHPEGDFVLESDLVRLPEEGEQAFTYSGIAVYHPSLFKNVTTGKQSVVPLLKAAMEQGKVGGQCHDGHWFDIGTPERLEALDRLLSRN